MDAHGTYSWFYMQNFPPQLQTPLSQKEKTFSGPFIASLKYVWNLQHFEKKVSILAWLFLKLLTAKELVTEKSKRSCFWIPFGNQRVNGFQTLLKSARHHYFRTFAWIRDKLSSKKPVLVWSEILRLFVNTLTADGKYFCRNMQNFQKQLQTPLCQKENNFSGIFFDFLNFVWNLQHFEKKSEYPSLIISEIIHSQRVGYFRTPFGNQPFNGFQTLLKSARHNYYRIFEWIRDKLSWRKACLSLIWNLKTVC